MVLEDLIVHMEGFIKSGANGNVRAIFEKSMIDPSLKHYRGCISESIRFVNPISPEDYLDLYLTEFVKLYQSGAGNALHDCDKKKHVTLSCCKMHRDLHWVWWLVTILGETVLTSDDVMVTATSIQWWREFQDATSLSVPPSLKSNPGRQERYAPKFWQL